MSTSSKEGQLRKSRSGTRKVSALSAEQLERKRANDREAQRSIRQRTKEHIEQLEAHVAMLQNQVAELQPQGDQFTTLLQRNANLEEEVARLKHQVATLTGRSDLTETSDGPALGSGWIRGGWNLSDVQANAASSVPSTGAMLSPHFPGPSHPPRAASAISAPGSNRSPHAHEWQSFSSTRSSSLASSNPDFSTRVDPYVLEGHPNQGPRLIPPSLSVAGPQTSFDGSTSSSNLQASGPSFPQVPSQRSMAMLTAHVSPAQTASGQPYHSSTPSLQGPQGFQSDPGWGFLPMDPQS